MRSLVLLGLFACGDVGGGSILTRHGQCDTAFGGVVLLSWTIRGAAPSAASCQGIDHLSIDIENGACAVTISPVPCALDKWRYDNLPEGSVTATVSAVGPTGATVASGATVVSLTATVPTSPAPINLQ